VLRVKARGQRDLITVVGHAAMISAGEFVQASGSWINDRTHGVQFRASFLKATAPTTVDGIEKYLGSGMIRGIGPVYAKKLVRAFGETVFDVIQQEPGRLRRIGEAAAGCRADVRCVQEGLTGHQGRATIAHRCAQTEDVAGEHTRLEDRFRYRGRQLLLRGYSRDGPGF
jgi:hypothetical protein